MRWKYTEFQKSVVEELYRQGVNMRQISLNFGCCPSSVKNWLARRGNVEFWHSLPPEDPIARFWEKVDKGKPEECWKWTGGCVSDGYGGFWYEGKQERSHRFVWKLVKGEIPEGMCVLHHCDNPPCVNPEHLWLGTNFDNVQDRLAKGRDNPPIGERAPWSRLDKLQVEAIKTLYQAGFEVGELTKLFPTSHSNLYQAATGRTWGHVEARSLTQDAQPAEAA